MLSSARRRWRSPPFPRVLLLLQRGRSPTGEQAAAAGHFHADDSHLLLHGQRQQLVQKTVVMAVGSVQGHQDRVEWMAADGLHQGSGRKWPVTPRCGRSSVPSLKQRFHRAALGEYVRLRPTASRYHAIARDPDDRSAAIQGLLKHAQGAIPGAFLGFAGQEGLARGVASSPRPCSARSNAPGRRKSMTCRCSSPPGRVRAPRSAQLRFIMRRSRAAWPPR